MLTYGLSRHRPLLVLAGLSTLAAAIGRLLLYQGFDAQLLELAEIRSQVRVSAGLYGLACLTLLFALLALLARSAAARGLFIGFAIVWIAAQVVLYGSTQVRLSFYGKPLLHIATFVWSVVGSSHLAILVITLLLLAGIGSTRRPRADPQDEYFVRERAAGGFSGFAFIIAMVLTTGWVVTVADAMDVSRLTHPDSLLDWAGLCHLAVSLALSVLGIVGWVMMLARKRLAGLALALFSIGFIALGICQVGTMYALEREYARFGDSLFRRQWPPMGVYAALLQLLEKIGIGLIGLVWGWRYLKAPPPLNSGSAFEPMMPAAAPVQHSDAAVR